MLLVRNIRLPLTCPDPEAEAGAQALRILRVPPSRAARCGVAKLSVDARHGKPVLVYTIAVTLQNEGEEPALAGASPCVCFKQQPQFSFPTGREPLAHRPVVVGLGPGRAVRRAAAGTGRVPAAGAGTRPRPGTPGRSGPPL